MTATSGRPKTFVREATGLVREISGFRAFVLNLMFTTAGAMLIFLVIGQGLFPGAYLPVSCLLGLIPALVVAYMYAQFSAAFPRSGGDYVFVGRVLHPSIGFMVNFVMTIINISSIGVEAVWITTMALGPTLNALSAVYGDPSLAALASALLLPANQLVIGVVLAIVLPGLMFFGNTITFRLKTLFFVITIVSVIAYIVAMAGTTQAQFIANYNSLSNVPYEDVVASAKSAGANLNYNFNDTLLGIVYVMLAVWGFTSSIYVGGEVRNPERSQVISMLAAPIVYIGLMTVITFVTYSSMGHDFLASIAYLALTGNTKYTLPAGLPILQFLAAYGTKNAALELLQGIGLLVTLLAFMMAATLTSVRCLFAWSFDAVIPQRFADVNDTYHVPHISLLAVIIIDVLFVVLTVYTPLAAYFTYVVTAVFLVVAVVGVAAIMFPRKRADAFNASPSMVTKRVGGIPLISILGAFAVVMGLLISYASLLPALVGPLNPLYITVVAVLFVLGFLIYWISYMVQKSRGIPVDIIQREIPPE